MDTESFLLRRQAILARLEDRRAKELPSHPFQSGNVFGMTFPWWMKWGVSLASRGGILRNILQVGLTVGAPLLFKKRGPFLGRLLSSVSSYLA